MVAADVKRRILARKTLPPSRRAKAPLRRDGDPPRYLGGYGSCDGSRTHPVAIAIRRGSFGIDYFLKEVYERLY
jgi:hypothetical protein